MQRRDFSTFPDDENGNVLWQMALNGVDLSYEREVDFALVFPNRDAALEFGAVAFRNGAKVQLSQYEENLEFPWQVYVHAVMAPTHENLTHFESMMGSVAEKVGGKNDGWGFEH